MTIIDPLIQAMVPELSSATPDPYCSDNIGMRDDPQNGQFSRSLRYHGANSPAYRSSHDLPGSGWKL
jgi:hypothetical protein